jgi:hypothetical protein
VKVRVVARQRSSLAKITTGGITQCVRTTMNPASKRRGLLLAALVFSSCLVRSDANRQCDHRRVEDRCADLEVHLRPVPGARREPRQQWHLGRDARRPEVLQRGDFEAARRTGGPGLEEAHGAAALDAGGRRRIRDDGCQAGLHGRPLTGSRAQPDGSARNPASRAWQCARGKRTRAALLWRVLPERW